MSILKLHEIRAGGPPDIDPRPAPVADDHAAACELYECSRDLIVLVDAQGNIVYANRAWRERLGYAPEAVSGMSIFDVVHRNDRAVCQAWLQTIGPAAPPSWTPMAFLTRDGAEVRVEGMAVARASGRGVVLQATFRDISDRLRAELAQRESEERFRLLSTHVPVGVFQTDRSGRLTYTNSRWRRMSGLPDVPEPRGVWWQAVHPDDRERVVAEWQSTLRHGHELVCEFRTGTSAESPTWARARVTQVYGADGNLASCIGITEDISDLKRIEQELAAARDAALEASRLKSQFLANMSHEVRTPMSGVIGLLDLLLETPLSTEQRQFAETARDSACQLLTLLKDLLDLARVEAGKLVIEFETFRLRTMVEECVRPLTVQARRKGLELKVVIDPRLPDLVKGDPHRLRQVMTNLLSNAIKFTERGQVDLEVVWGGGNSATVQAQFFVRDTGIGIPAEAHGRLFQPFVQVDGSTTRRYGGTGLGLAISRRLVELMGGDIGFRSVVNEGSQFWFTLPLAVPDAAETKAFTQTASAAELQRSLLPSNEAFASLRVLVAEDSPVNLKAVSWILERLGCQIVVATNGHEVLSALERQWCDLILMDCQMPGMDGIEATRRVRELEAERRRQDPTTPPIYIAALTAHALEGDAERCRAGGMDDYVSKPARAADIEAVLRRCLAHNRPAQP